VLDDTTLRRYLLGEMPESEMEALEQEYFVDSELLGRIRGVEHDLIDDYVADLLGPQLRQAFERNCLVTPAQRERVAAARALRRLSADPRAAGVRRPEAHDASAIGSRFWPAFGSLAAILLLSLVAVRWWGPSATISETTAPSVARVEQSPILVAPTPGGAETARPARAAFVLALAPLLTRGRGEPPEVRLPPRTAEVLVEFQGEPGSVAASARLRASIDTVEGQAVWSGRAQAHTGGTRSALLASARVPASVLKPDDYIATLTLEGGSDAASFRYFFRVVE
jgi:hypothetical protein